MLIFFCLGFILLSSFGASAKTINDSVAGSKCLETETECGNGCCPLRNGTCCTETQTCCQQGAVCIGPLSICLGLKSGSSLYSEQAVRLRDVNRCPRGYTQCDDECCPFSNAVCCSKGLICCPDGWTCMDAGYCKSGGKDQNSSLNEVHPRPFPGKKSMLRLRPHSVKTGKRLYSERTVNLKGVTKCSSGYFQCYEGCCEDGDTCCNPFMGDYECCANYEFCTPFGCTHK